MESRERREGVVANGDEHRELLPDCLVLPHLNEHVDLTVILILTILPIEAGLQHSEKLGVIHKLAIWLLLLAVPDLHPQPQQQGRGNSQVLVDPQNIVIFDDIDGLLILITLCLADLYQLTHLLTILEVALDLHIAL